MQYNSMQGSGNFKSVDSLKFTLSRLEYFQFIINRLFGQLTSVFILAVRELEY